LGTCPWVALALAVTVRHAGHEPILLPIGREQRQCRLDQYGFGLNRQIQPKPMKLIAKIVLERVRDNASRSR
jgi:hypothetical protein